MRGRFEVNEARDDLLPPILPPAQQVGYGRTLRIVVIVIADRGRQYSGRRDKFVNDYSDLGPQSKFEANRSMMVTVLEGPSTIAIPASSLLTAGIDPRVDGRDRSAHLTAEVRDFN